MDYSELNIYNKDKFVLRSEIRKMQFPFIRYNGSNYTDLVSFITSASPNTKIPAAKKLKVGELYSFSRRQFRFIPVPIRDLRFVIASNPYLVISEEEILPLALEYQQAVDYLKENRHHKLFAYEDILATYKYFPEYDSFKMFDRTHPKGVVLKELPKFTDWYIGGDDEVNHMWCSMKVIKKEALHMVDARPDFEDVVDIIDSVKYSINKSLHVQGRHIMFNVNWEDYARRRTLKHTCHNVHEFKSFISALYTIVFDETVSESFGEFANESIVRIVEELHSHYDLGKNIAPSRNNDWPFSINQIFQIYLEHNLGPQEPDDYSKLQEGILIDFHAFVEKIFESIREKMKIVGTICQDDFGNIYCGKALLHQKFKCYCGCKCEITTYTKNVDDSLEQFQYYCDSLNSVAINQTGVISQDEEGTFYLGNFIFNDSVADQLGEQVQIRLIQPFDWPRGQYLGEVLDYIRTEEIEEEHSIQIPTAENDSPNPYHFEIPDDIFNEDKGVADDTKCLSSLKPAITLGINKVKDFQELFDFILKWGKIKEPTEQKAMLTLLTGYSFPGTANRIRWCCDQYMPRVLFYIIKHISDDKRKYPLIEDEVDFYSNDEKLVYDINKDLGSITEARNPSSTVEKKVPPEIKRALNKIYPTLF
jgi:hypothetical protein